MIVVEKNNEEKVEKEKPSDEPKKEQKMKVPGKRKFSTRRNKQKQFT